MSANHFLLLVIQYAFVSIAILTVVNFVRYRDITRFDTALMFCALALLVLVLTSESGANPPWVSWLGSAAAAAQPYLLLRLVVRFRPVPRWVHVAAFIAMIGASITLLGIPLAMRPPLLTALAVIYFTSVQMYCAAAFLHGALAARGILRWRMGLAAAGSGLLGATILLAALYIYYVVVALPSVAPFVTALGVTLLILGALSYYLGFTPPRLLRRAWQFRELHYFMREASGFPARERARLTLELLCTAAVRAAAGLSAAVALQTDEEDRFAIRPSREYPALSGTLRAGEGAVAQAWRERKPSTAYSPAQMGEDCARLAATIGANAIYAIPIATPERGLGVLIVFYRRRPIFVADHLSMLSLLADQTALVLEYDTLLEETRKLNAELEQRVIGRTAQLETANRELDAFAHTVAHEFKSPLTQITGYAQIVEMDNADKLDEEALNNLRMIRQGVDKMASISDELLLLAKMRDGDEIPIEPLDMAAVVSEAKRRLAAQIEKTQASVVMPRQWPAARGHAPWIEEVWVNYVGNAIKYGGKTPRIELGADVQTDGMVRCWVKDNGPGIKLEGQSRLFAPFVRLQPNHGGGHGLGLSIARRIVEKCGGQVGVESEGVPGKGSEFWFTLPGI